MKQKRLIVIFLFFALTLMACNLTSMLPGNRESSESESTPEVNLDDSVQEATQEPDVQEPASSQPESQPPASSGARSSLGSSPQTACDHPYFPLREGASWVYYDPSDIYYYHWDVESVTGDLQNANAVMKVYINEYSEPTEEQKQASTQLTYNWVCSASEGIVSFDMATLKVSDMGEEAFTLTMENIEGEGVMIPPAERLTPGYSWELTLSADFSAEALMGATGSMVAKDIYSVTGNEAVEFDGQTFEGLQYQRQFQNDMELMLNGVAMPLPNIDFEFLTDTVMAKGVGYLLLDSDSAEFGSTGLQLVRYNIP